MIDARKHTLDSVKKLTDYSDFNLYKMDICYDYSIDKIIDRGIFDDESALGAIVQEVLSDYPVNLKMPNFGCSAFTMKNPDSVMMGRNYDFKNDTSSMLVYCSPKDGYRSVAFAALDNVGANNPELSDETRLATLLSPFISLDGINEKGVSIAVLTLDSKPVRQQSGKPVIATTLAIRLILDRAASTEEAVTLFEKYDMFASSGRDYHFYVTDASGDGRVIEYDCNSDDRKLVVTKSPAEMNTYLPKYKALWMAENCSGTMHNLYTLRGAEVRDGNAWAQYIMEAKELFGDKTEVVFQAHNWPHWGNDVINDYMANTASVYKYIFSQTLMYINQGYTSTEIANMMELPDELNKVWYTRQYYGTLKHNVKAVYQKYMGWYDENPIHLDELEPTEYSKKLVEYLGDTDKVLEMAKKDFDKGEYQWVAQITNTLVYADPENKDARYLCADALEQLGYQAESGAWRNAYLTGAYELRNGTKNYPNSEGSGATALGMSTETMIDYLGICLDEKKLEDQNLVINLEVTDKNAKYLLRINHGVLIYSQEKWSDKADATIKTKSAGILGIAQNNQKLMDAGIEKVEGNSDIIKTLTSSVAEFPLYFNIIEP